MDPTTTSSPLLRILNALLAGTGALAMTFMFFMVLPLLQVISKRPQADLELRRGDTAELPPPPPVVEEEKREDKEEPQPPDLADEAPPLDLSQLELALNPGFGDSGGAGDFAIRIAGLAGGDDKGLDDLFGLQDLDQKPRPIYQQNPTVTSAMKKRMPATVHLLFTVNENGRVESPVVQSSTDAMFEAPALAAVKQWKFEPGKRGGQPVRFRMRQPVTFK